MHCILAGSNHSESLYRSSSVHEFLRCNRGASHDSRCAFPQYVLRNMSSGRGAPSPVTVVVPWWVSVYRVVRIFCMPSQPHCNIHVLCIYDSFIIVIVIIAPLPVVDPHRRFWRVWLLNASRNSGASCLTGKSARDEIISIPDKQYRPSHWYRASYNWYQLSGQAPSSDKSNYHRSNHHRTLGLGYHFAGDSSDSSDSHFDTDAL